MKRTDKPVISLLKSFVYHKNEAEADRLCVLISEHFQNIQVLKSLPGAGSQNEVMKTDWPDVVFVDLDSIGSTESEFRATHTLGNYEIIFLLNTDERVFKTFEFLSIDFLRQPVDLEELREVLARCQVRRLRKITEERTKDSDQYSTERIALPHKKGYEFVGLDKVIRIEGDENYSKFYLEVGRVLLITKHLGTYERLLDGKGFFRTHRKHIVNLNHILSFERGKQGLLYMNEGHSVPLSEKRKGTFLDILKSGIIF